jgi:hypothetical protein
VRAIEADRVRALSVPDLISAQLIQLGAAAAAVITGSSIKCALQCRLAYMRATAIADVLTDNALGETVGSEKLDDCPALQSL